MHMTAAAAEEGPLPCPWQGTTFCARRVPSVLSKHLLRTQIGSRVLSVSYVWRIPHPDLLCFPILLPKQMHE